MDNLNHDNNVSLVDVLYAMSRRRQLFLKLLTVVVIVTVGLSLIIPKRYESTAIILLPEKASSALEFLSGNLGLNAASLGMGGPNHQRYIAILDSRRLKEAIIDSFDLMTVYDCEDIYGALDELDKNFIIENNFKMGTITLSMRYPGDAQKAADIVNFAIRELDLINRRLSTEQASSTRKFIEKRYLEAREEVRTSEDSLKEFQKRHGVISITDQTKASIEAAAELEKEILMGEIEFNVYSKSLGVGHPEVLRTKEKLSELRRKQSQMESGGLGTSLFIPFDQTQDIGVDYFRFYRQVQINMKIVEFLVPQYEQARIQEAKDTPTLLVLDHAQPAPRPYWPRKKLLVFFMALFTLGFFFFFVYLQMVIRKYRAVDITKKEKLDYVFRALKPKNWLSKEG